MALLSVSCVPAFYSASGHGVSPAPFTVSCIRAQNALAYCDAHPTTTLQEIIHKATRVRGSFVSIEAGDRASIGDGDTWSIYLLSPVLNQYPSATKFQITWSYTVALGTDEYRLVYDRMHKTLQYGSGGRGQPVRDEPAYQGVTDNIIHAIARKNASFRTVTNYGCTLVIPSLNRTQRAIEGTWDIGHGQHLQFFANGTIIKRMPNPDSENAKHLPVFYIHGSFSLSERNELTLYYTHMLVKGHRVNMKMTQFTPKIVVGQKYATVTNLQHKVLRWKRIK